MAKKTQEAGTVITVHSEAIPGGGASQEACQLVVIEGPDMGRAVTIRDEPVTVGTFEDADLILTDDRVSRIHMTVHQDSDGRFVVRDLESLNGTLYLGSMITEASLPVGVTLKVGRSFLRIQARPMHLDVTPSQSRRFGELVAESLAMREVIAVMELAAESEATVLIEGETGTGKELTARAIHEASKRRSGPFVVIDCGALPTTLLESELFGHVKGAFTGASTNRLGAFARASGGTIFLDELGSIPLDAQARMLRVIEERMVRPVGADREKAIDVRIIAASSTFLETKVAEGTFRPDLYYRLSVIRVALPPLRARREDIVPIVKELMRRRGMDAGRIQGRNLHRLMAHRWPGNVRELRNVLERAIAMSPKAERFEDLRVSLKPETNTESVGVRTDLPYADAKALVLRAFEQQYLRDVFDRCEGNISATARASELDRKHLRSLLRKHGLLENS